jgi:hypothetical protein
VKTDDDIKDTTSSEVTSSVLQKKRTRKVVANTEKPTDEVIKSSVKPKPKKLVKKAIIKDKESDVRSQKTVLLEKEKKAPVKKAPVKKVKNNDLEVDVSVESKEPKRKGWWSTK